MEAFVTGTKTPQYKSNALNTINYFMRNSAIWETPINPADTLPQIFTIGKDTDYTFLYQLIYAKCYEQLQKILIMYPVLLKNELAYNKFFSFGVILSFYERNAIIYSYYNKTKIIPDDALSLLFTMLQLEEKEIIFRLNRTKKSILSEYTLTTDGIECIQFCCRWTDITNISYYPHTQILISVGKRFHQHVLKTDNLNNACSPTFYFIAIHTLWKYKHKPRNPPKESDNNILNRILNFFN